MFEQSMIPNRAKTGRAWTVVVGFLGQLAAVGVAVLIPLIAFDKLPAVKLIPLVYAPPPPPPPPRLEERSVRIVAVDRQVTRDGGLRAPAFIPTTVRRIVENPLPPDAGSEIGIVGGVEGGVRDGVIRGIVRDVAQFHPPVLPPPVTKRDAPVVAKPVPVGGKVMLAKLVNQVKPEYPAPARAIRVQGTVSLQAVIGRDGHIRELQVVSGHALLVNAAVDAVRQWVYQPTTLNGQPVEVITTIEVKFILQH